MCYRLSVAGCDRPVLAATGLSRLGFNQLTSWLGFNQLTSWLGFNQLTSVAVVSALTGYDDSRW
jgi:hypothetical protein